jgi:glycosyltransferase involved in cell wall biosynthesis
MKVLLVGNYEPDAQQSMLRYAELLRAGMEARGHQVEVVRPGRVFSGLVPRTNPLWKWLGYVDKFLIFPPLLWLKTRSADLVHICDHSNSSYLRWVGKTPSLITAHDLLAIRSALGDFSQTQTGSTGKVFQRWILSGLNRARHVVSVSGKTKADLEAILSSKPEIVVIHHGLNWKYEPATSEEIAAVRAACGLAPDDEYLLHVGSNQWYKNRLGVLRIALALRKHERFKRVKMVLAGKPWTEEMRAIQREHGFEDAIEMVTPSNEQIQALYSGALAFLFPSFEEGFGWPILEAQACGCPVITSARPPMTEVAGNSAILIDPEDPEGAARTIAARIGEAEELQRAGWENLKRFSTEKMMASYGEAYESIVGRGKSR